MPLLLLLVPGAGGLHDTYGSALAAQPGQSQGRSVTNSGSQPIVRGDLPTFRAPGSPVPVRPRLRQRSSRRRREPKNSIPVTNLLERLFVEERRRLKIIPNGFGEKPVLKLMFGALVRAAERWRGLPFTEFELRQLAAIREDLNREYKESITPTARSSQPRFSSRILP